MRMAIHPDDPPWSIFGLPRIITGRASLDRLVSLVDSPANGITFCTGSLGSSPDNDLPTMAARFASAGRIHFAHCRNVRVDGPGSFHEVPHPSRFGDVDMAAVLAALHDNGFDGPMRPDHGRMIWGETGRAGLRSPRPGARRDVSPGLVGRTVGERRVDDRATLRVSMDRRRAPLRRDDDQLRRSPGPRHSRADAAARPALDRDRLRRHRLLVQSRLRVRLSRFGPDARSHRRETRAWPPRWSPGHWRRWRMPSREPRWDSRSRAGCSVSASRRSSRRRSRRWRSGSRKEGTRARGRVVQRRYEHGCDPGAHVGSHRLR